MFVLKSLHLRESSLFTFEMKNYTVGDFLIMIYLICSTLVFSTLVTISCSGLPLQKSNPNSMEIIVKS